MTPTDADPVVQAKERALRLLGTRWRSRGELERRLRAAGIEPEAAEAALADLERSGLVDDGRVAREVVRDQAERRMAGSRAIRSELWRKDVPAGVGEAALAAAGDEAERAGRLAASRVGRLAGLPPDVAFRRLHGLLLRRGYDSSVALEACRAALAGAIDDTDAGGIDGA
jgi:regulatory protein